MKILLTGATGLIGKEVGKKLVRDGHQLVVISRESSRARLELPFPCEIVEGDLLKGPIQSLHLQNIEGVVHLMGESIAEGRWTDKKKQRILDSRVKGTASVIQSLKNSGNQSLKVFISASATGAYGNRGDEELTEASARGNDFLAEVCALWEEASAKVKVDYPDVRWMAGRFGIVLSAKGGAVMKMLTPFRLGLGGALGDGQQWMSWIDLDDLVNVLAQAVQDDRFEGVVNVVSPNPVRNLDFSRELAKSFGKKLGPSVPKFALKLAVGELATALLGSQKVKPTKLAGWGFQFQCADIEEAFTKVASFFQNGEMLLWSEQYLPFKKEEIFPFFANARNLEKITPDLLNFKIVGMSTDQIREGTLIDYQLKLRGFPMRWKTKIEKWTPNESFVDIQLRGPYKKWEHQHDFESMGEGTLMRDQVRYKVPFGWAGWLASGWFVSRDVGQIFDYRRQVCASRDFKKS